MYEGELEDDMEDLASAEEFMDYFEIDYDADVLKVNRLHILQRFHNYMNDADLPEDEENRKAAYRELLAKAYLDFVESDALTERVFKVLREAGKPQGFVSLGEIKVTKS